MPRRSGTLCRRIARMPTRRPQPDEGTSRCAGAILLALTALALWLAFAGFGPRVAAAEAAPMAFFTVSEKPTVGVPVVFDASTSTGEITSYKWEFETGQKGEGETVAHT